MSQPILFLIFLFFITCKGNKYDVNHYSSSFTERSAVFETINDIPSPPGYERILPDQGSFGEWLSAIHLKKDNHVYLYDGSLKKNQFVHFAVLDIMIGKKNLQQC